MWGSDYPHHEACWPYSRESLRRTFAGWSEDDLRQILAGTAASVYGFDLDLLAPIAAEFGPDGRRDRHPARPDPGRRHEPVVPPQLTWDRGPPRR